MSTETENLKGQVIEHMSSSAVVQALHHADTAIHVKRFEDTQSLSDYIKSKTFTEWDEKKSEIENVDAASFDTLKLMVDQLKSDLDNIVDVISQNGL